ncbi:GGDEF domain-containing protein [Salinimonas sp. HHU 13199]|uniref:diguanylate cyclase n=1 Tax=Salinimonas profundi TaxID=2729140 RepID=A0ABR8LMQ6_9ALTE|nr:GGDEF domain-containing protein [Salinimonas profundi]MBD3585380.1 GGDEF domain-containing protein [Salinimonas profundi]
MDFISNGYDSTVETSYPLCASPAELDSSQLHTFVNKILSTLETRSLCSVYFHQTRHHLPVRKFELSSISPSLSVGEQMPLETRPVKISLCIGNTCDERADHACIYYFTRTLTRGERNLLGQMHMIFVQQLKQALAFEQLKKMATKDTLTGLSNRNGFNEASIRLISRAVRYGDAFALLVIDLDNFKTVNDTMGHNEGDAVLERVAGIIRNTLRAGDEAFRFGGDEFCCLLDCATAQCINSVASRIRNRVGQDAYLTERGVSCSIGGATYRAGDDINSLFDRADGALYAVKANGKNAFSAA